MVRTTVACAPCRKMKIKCVHDGTPPCRNCRKKGRVQDGQCVLTLPDLSSKSGRKEKSRRELALDNAQLEPTLGSSTNPSPNPGRELPQRSGANNERSWLMAKGDLSGVISVFSRKFPELRFIHEPTFSKALQGLSFSKSASCQIQDVANNSTNPNDRLLYASLLALCYPLMERQEDGGTTVVSAEDFATYVRGRISITDLPNLTLVQTLLVLSMYEWGTGSGYRAWTFSGMATRMMQSLHILTPRHTLRGAEREIYNRTFWSCFIMDRLVFCGKPQPFTLTISALSTHWPVSEEDFAFGEPSNQPERTDEEQGLLEHMRGDMNHYYGILVRGFDIWARILKWVVSGGRRLPGMSLPENHPWVEGSPWRLLYDELQTWRRLQDRRLHYVAGSPKSHAALGNAEGFGFLNLIYYVSLIFLGREYIPFLPRPESEPAGPVDPPLLTTPAPSNWWHERAFELFSSAEKIPSLLQELEDANASLNTPFAGFCAFTAATMNLYISSFPNMNLKKSADTSLDALVLNLQLLDRFRRIWPMGEGWWATIQHCKRLYEHASRDTAGFRGRTRDDFIALEYSIHDSRGQPPVGQDEGPTERNIREEENTNSTFEGQEEAQGSWIPDSDPHAAAASTLQELSAAYNEGTGDGMQTWAEDVPGDWYQSWPFWGEQQNVPYAVEGIPFDYNLDMLGG